MTVALIVVAGILLIAGLVVFVRYDTGAQQRRADAEFAEQGFDKLARYNEECAHGIVHDLEYDRQMRATQHRYDQWARTKPEPPL